VFLARPGLGPNAARLGELTFALLRRGGVEGERAVEAFRVLLIYSLGFAAFQAPRLQVDSPARTEQVAATFASLPEDRFPQLRRLAGHLAAHTTSTPACAGCSTASPPAGGLDCTPLRTTAAAAVLGRRPHRWPRPWLGRGSMVQ
jgi:Tetracyclin repressor-like, C-terminal domain